MMGEAQGAVGSQEKWLTLPGVGGAKEGESRKTRGGQPSKEQGGAYLAKDTGCPKAWGRQLGLKNSQRAWLLSGSPK